MFPVCHGKNTLFLITLCFQFRTGAIYPTELWDNILALTKTKARNVCQFPGCRSFTYLWDFLSEEQTPDISNPGMLWDIYHSIQTIYLTHTHTLYLYMYILYICIYFTYIKICILYIYISILTCLSISHFIEVQ